MKQSQHTRAVLAETLPGRRAVVMGQCPAAQPRGDGPGASEDAAPASARGPCPAVRDAGMSRVVGDLCAPSPMQTILRAESREPRAESTLRDAAHLWTLGEHDEAFRRIESTWMSNQASAILASEMIRACAERHELERAEEVLDTFEAAGPEHAIPHVANTLVDVLIDTGGESDKEKSAATTPAGSSCVVRTGRYGRGHPGSASA